MALTHQIEKWFISYEKDVTNYLVYYTGTYDVEDLVQDTFLRAFRAFHQYRQEANPKTWLISIARNTAIDYYRKKSIMQKLKDVLNKEAPRNNELLTDEAFIQQEEFANLYQEINKLKSNYRDVILLRGISELSSKEVGQVLGWSENKVNVTFSRAVKKLNEQMKDGEYFEQLV